MSEFSDPAWASPETLERYGVADGDCDDCHKVVRWGGHTCTTQIGTSKRLCDPCYRWRAARRLEFDHRAKAVLEELTDCISCGGDASTVELDDDRPARLCDACFNDTCARARRAAAMNKTKTERLLELANIARHDGRDDEADVLIIRAKLASHVA